VVEALEILSGPTDIIRTPVEIVNLFGASRVSFLPIETPRGGTLPEGCMINDGDDKGWADVKDAAAKDVQSPGRWTRSLAWWQREVGAICTPDGLVGEETSF